MLKKGDCAIIYNHELRTKEIGKILKKWRREEVNFYSIKTERGTMLEGISSVRNQLTSFVDEDLSIKYNLKLQQND